MLVNLPNKGSFQTQERKGVEKDRLRSGGKLTVVLTGWYPSRFPLCLSLWCVFPKVTQGRHHVVRHRSTGLKHPNRLEYHGCASAGDLELRTSPGWARTSLARPIHSWTSSLSMGPFWAG